MTGQPNARVAGRERWLVIGCLVTVYVVWGSTYLAIRVMVETIPPLLGAGGRFVVAGSVLAAILLVRNRDSLLSLSRREVAGAGAVGVLILVGGIGLVTVAETDVPSALTALIVASVPLFVVVLRALHGESVTRATGVAVSIGFLGVGGLVLPGSDASGGAAGPMLLVVAASVFTAVGAFYSKRLATPRDVLAATVVEMLVAGSVLLAASVVLGELARWDASDVSAGSAVAFVYLVAFGSVVAYSAFVWLLENAPVSTVATYAYVNPLVALALGAAILGEDISPGAVAAALAIIGSVFLVVRAETPERTDQ